MDVELMILGFLMSGPKTGYRLKAISGKMMMFYSITLNQIYPALRKLEEAGYIKKEIIFQTGKPNKHLYSPTKLGKEYFLEKITGPPAPVDMSFPFLIRAFFFRFLDDKDIAKELEKEIQSLDKQLGDLDKARPTVETRADTHGRFVYTTTVSLLQSMRDLYIQESEKFKNLRNKEKTKCQNHSIQPSKASGQRG
jgi:DNA-binding PadR family transcriptional regulator